MIQPLAKEKAIIRIYIYKFIYIDIRREVFFIILKREHKKEKIKNA